MSFSVLCKHFYVQFFPQFPTTITVYRDKVCLQAECTCTKYRKKGKAYNATEIKGS